MLDRSLVEMIQHLIARDLPRTGDGQRLLEAVGVKVAEPPRRDLPLLDQLFERGDRLLNGAVATVLVDGALEAMDGVHHDGDGAI